MDTTHCPDCGAPAEVEWRAVLESTDGPVEHARIRCAQQHWFMLPVSALATAGQRPPARHTQVPTTPTRSRT
jgi:hypothetical protein